MLMSFFGILSIINIKIPLANVWKTDTIKKGEKSVPETRQEASDFVRHKRRNVRNGSYRQLKRKINKHGLQHRKIIAENLGFG